ncbi:MAG: hypothetical protein LBV80_08155 [Deltaproteobacteria bacterium]|nr:hypothetical protein [Deltaproteobacteria bacterium]
MTVEEAIKHANSIALSCGNPECARQHLALIDWLGELVRLRNENAELRARVEAAEEVIAATDALEALIEEIKKKTSHMSENVLQAWFARWIERKKEAEQRVVEARAKLEALKC